MGIRVAYVPELVFENSGRPKAFAPAFRGEDYIRMIREMYDGISGFVSTNLKYSYLLSPLQARCKPTGL
jgi:hypothetical protein